MPKRSSHQIPNSPLHHNPAAASGTNAVAALPTDSHYAKLEGQMASIHEEQQLCRRWVELHRRNIASLSHAIAKLAPQLQTLLLNRQTVAEGLLRVVQHSPNQMFVASNYDRTTLKGMEEKLMTINSSETFQRAINEEAAVPLIGVSLMWLNDAAMMDDDGNQSTSPPPQGCVPTTRQALFFLFEVCRHRSVALNDRKLRPQLRALLVHIENLSDREGLLAELAISKEDIHRLCSQIRAVARLAV